MRGIRLFVSCDQSVVMRLKPLKKIPRHILIHAAGTVTGLIVAYAFGNGPANSQVQSFSHELISSDTTFQVDVGGSVDAVRTRKYNASTIFRFNGGDFATAGFENNLSMTLENASGALIRNPVLEINGKRFLYTFRDLVNDIPLQGLATIDDTIKAIQRYLADNFLHWTTSSNKGTWTINPLRTLNVFGAGLCDLNASVFTAVLHYLGYDVSVFSVPSHTIGLLRQNGRTLVLDGDMRVFYDDRKNRSLVNLEQMWNDHDLVRRQHHGGMSQGEFEMDSTVALFHTPRQGFWTAAMSAEDSMTLRLRPHEKFTFTWNTQAGKYQFYHVYYPLNPPPPTYSQGYQEYCPVFSASWFQFVAETTNVAIDGLPEAPRLVAADSSRPASFVINNPNPYAIVESRVVISYQKVDSLSTLTLSFTKDSLEGFTTAYTSRNDQTGFISDTVDLTQLIQPIGTPITNDFLLKFAWDSQTSQGIAIDSFKVLSGFQLNPNVLPALRVGSNTVRLMSSDGAPFQGLVYTHSFCEVDSLAVPPPVTQPIFPPNGAQIGSSQFEFSWQPPPGLPPGQMSDCQIEVSDRSDFRFPVSSVFRKVTSQAGWDHPTWWRIPLPGLLSPNTRYYWHVCVRSIYGVYSDWSPAWSFEVRIPGIVLNPSITEEGDSVCVRWDPNPVGVAPAKYVVLASDLRGFSPQDGHVLDTVMTQFYTIKNTLHMIGFAYYRIIPIGVDSSIGGASDLISVGNMRLLSRDPGEVTFGDTIHVPLVAIQPKDEYIATDHVSRVVVTDSLKVTSLPEGFTVVGDSLTGAVNRVADTLITIGATTTDSHQQLSFTIPLEVQNLPPLPIQLASFTAVVSGQGLVRLEWVTLSEMNNYGFEVQKSVHQLSNYQTVANGFVPGHGTTLEPQHYSFTDSAAGSGVWWYRLKQIDLDGTTSYCDPARVEIMTEVKREEEIPTVFSLAQNYPNPWNPSTTIRYGLPHDSKVELEVYNVLGQRVALIVNAQQRKGYHQVVLNSDGLASGTYFYRLHADDFVQMRKLILLR